MDWLSEMETFCCYLSTMREQFAAIISIIDRIAIIDNVEQDKKKIAQMDLEFGFFYFLFLFFCLFWSFLHFANSHEEYVKSECRPILLHVLFCSFVHKLRNHFFCKLRSTTKRNHHYRS